MYAIDLFCGAGGFSEGILQAGFHIVFSSDRSSHVMETYKNRHKQLGLIQGKNTHFELADIRELEGEYILRKINELSDFKDKKQSFKKGDIDAIFGGPPCQGFSIAGKRDKSDPRNMLFREYLRVIKDIQPKYIVMENVTGFMSMQVNPDFKSFNNVKYRDDELVSTVVQTELEGFGYTVLKPKILDASDFGVPQRRLRVIVLAYKKDVTPIEYPIPTTINENEKITVEEALAGVSIRTNKMNYAIASSNGRTPHFESLEPVSNFVKHFNMEESKHNAVIQERFSLFNQGESVVNLKSRLLKKKNNGELILDLRNYPNLLIETVFTINKEFNLNILRRELNNNKMNMEKNLIVSLYKRIIKLWDLEVDSNLFLIEAKKPIGKMKMEKDAFTSIFNVAKKEFNRIITKEELVKLFINDSLNTKTINIDWNEILNALLTNKNTRTRLDSQKTGPTMVTLPDDFIHPTLNKILNVREMARIQSFDDSFEFLGKRTTGGDKRKDEVPQFTQVGNAVPPLLAFAIAQSVRNALEAKKQLI
ncbi:hypothetical protein BSBH6_02723 [Bacillus subtilis]|nr:hypothetical protein UM89_18990 [Bacillus subtilis]RPK03249.1 hypothetical protein BSBH6_02723 [Bacillus subtilis]RPK23689.1 hypothetical protein BH5_02720 [Bacillus subtilis]